MLYYDPYKFPPITIRRHKYSLTKRDKQAAKLLAQKTLSSDDAVRLMELYGWYPDPDNPQKGSHKHFVHPTKRGKVTIPLGREVLRKDTRDSILNQAGLIDE